MRRYVTTTKKKHDWLKRQRVSCTKEENRPLRLKVLKLRHQGHDSKTVAAKCKISQGSVAAFWANETRGAYDAE